MWKLVNVESGSPVFFGVKDWPIWIHGVPKSGAAFATTTLVTTLLQQGQRIIFLCAHGQEIRRLQQQLKGKQPEVRAPNISAPIARQLETMQLITLKKEKSGDILAQLRAISDWTKRIVVITNVEEVLTPALWTVVQTAEKYVLSGDFLKLNMEVPYAAAATHIAFSSAPPKWPVQIPDRPSYIGEYWHNTEHGQIIAREFVGD